MVANRVLATRTGLELGCGIVATLGCHEAGDTCTWFDFLWCHCCMHQLRITAAGGMDASMHQLWTNRTKYVLCALALNESLERNAAAERMSVSNACNLARHRNFAMNTMVEHGLI